MKSLRTITNFFYKKTRRDEEIILKVCNRLLDQSFIEESQCLITIALLAKYFKAKEIEVKVHFGFIGEVGNPTNVIESHLWLSYKKKRIDITAHKQLTPLGDFSSEAYILNIPIPKTKSDKYFTKGLDRATKDEKEMLYDIVKIKNASSVKYFESASANKDSSIDYRLIKEFMNDPYDMENATKKEFDDKYEEFKDAIELPNYLQNTSIAKLWDN